MSALHARPHTLAPSASFECVCGWRANSSDIRAAADEFDEHFRDVGYQLPVGNQPKEQG